MGSWNLFISSATFIHILKLIQFIPLSYTHGNTAIPDSSNTLNEKQNYDKPTYKFGSLHTLTDISKWSALEENISIVLTERLDYLLKEEMLIETYLKDYNETSGEALANVYKPKATPKERGEVIGSSAVLGHRMITRYTSTVAQLKELLRSPGYKESKDLVHSILRYAGTQTANQDSFLMEWPNWQDKFMSSMGLLHLMEVYGRAPREIRFGLNIDTNFGGSLTAHDSVEIGIFALVKKYYYISIQWFEFGKLLIIEGDTSAKLDLVQSLLNMAIVEHNEIWKITQQSKSKLSQHEYFKHIRNQYNTPILESIPEENKATGRAVIYYEGSLDKSANSFPRDIANFLDTCTKYVDNPKRFNERSKLKCYYENKKHPYLHINPAKVEILSDTPPIYQFYDVLGDKEIEKIKKVGTPSMSRSTVVGTELDEISDIGTFVSSVLLDLDLENVMKYAGFISGLEVLHSSEPTQINEYAYGRFCNVHSDATSSMYKIFGDRVATILYYVETPELGGLTPFSDVGVAANMVRGSAILWYNMYRNGSSLHTLHGSCPVIHGHKTIIHHWVLYEGNFEKYKCSLNQFE